MPLRAVADKEAHQAGYCHLWSEGNQRGGRGGLFMLHELSVQTVPKEETPRWHELWQCGCTKSVEHH